MVSLYGGVLALIVELGWNCLTLLPPVEVEIAVNNHEHGGDNCETDEVDTEKEQKLPKKPLQVGWRVVVAAVTIMMNTYKVF